jgi:hypothetical protein
MDWLQQTKAALNIQLSDTAARTHQVASVAPYYGRQVDVLNGVLLVAGTGGADAPGDGGDANQRGVCALRC